MSKDRSTIYFVRHGECMGNASRRNLAPDEAVLSDNGKLQAKLLGQHLEDVPFTLAFTSPYARTLETAQTVLSGSKVSSSIELQQDARIRELFLGEKLENGAEIKLILQAFIQSKKDFLDFCPEGAETRQDMVTRIESFLQDLFQKIDEAPQPQTVLVVTHGAVLLHLWGLLLQNKDNKYSFQNWHQDYYKVSRNTGYYVVSSSKLSPGNNSPRELNVVAALCSEHLKPLAKDTLDKYTHEDKTAGAFKGCIQQ